MKNVKSLVTENGALRVKGNKIVNKDDKMVSFAGNSYFWSNPGWGGDKFYNTGTVAELVNNWNTPIVRVAMGAEDENGYLQLPDENLESIQKVIDKAIDLGIYVIIDWHSHFAINHTDKAIEFFELMANKYGEHDNIIYEIYNEPSEHSPGVIIEWSEVKAYAEAVIPAIRAIDDKHLIIVGTPRWSQDVHTAADDQLDKNLYPNVAYALHFYAATHKESVRENAIYAITKDAPIALFVTEWGTVDNLGQGEPDCESTDEWMTFLKENEISHCNWSICDKIEGPGNLSGASALAEGANENGEWNYPEDLTNSGIIVKEIIGMWDDYDSKKISFFQKEKIQ